MEFILFILVVGGVVWLIRRATSTKDEIAQLNSRVDFLQIQIDRLTRARANETKTTAPITPTFAAEPPPKKSPEPEATIPSIIPAAAIEEVLIIPPLAPPPIISPLPENVFSPEPVFENKKNSAAPSPEPPPLLKEKASFEMRLGTFWLVRIGIVMLLTGLAFFANFAYHNVVPRLGPAGKISLLYLASGLLLAAGTWWQRRNVKEPLKNFAQVVFAGGLAAVYFTTYAAHHIPPLRIIQSALFDGTLLLAWAGIVAWLADRRKSEVMAMFAVGLAFFTSVITRVGEFTLWSNLILTIAAVFFLVRNRWTTLSFASLITTYAGYAFWRFLREDGWRWANPDENLLFGAGFLASYWLVFTTATFLSKSEKLSGVNRASFLTLNNGAFFALFLLTMLQIHTSGFWKFSLGYGTILLALAGLAKNTLPTEIPTKNAYLTQGLLLITLGFITKFSGTQLALILGVESTTLFVLAIQGSSRVLKSFAFAAALLATSWCVINLNRFDFHGLLTGCSLVALLIFNAFWSRRTAAGKNLTTLRAEPSFFVLLALLISVATTWLNSTAEHFPLVLALEAVALTLSIYVLRVRELTFFGQLILIGAQVSWLAEYLEHTPPWWNPLLLIAITFGLSHWWQKQKTLILDKQFTLACQGIFALASVALIFVWLHPLVSVPAWLALSSLLAIVITVYGLVTRAWPLAIGGQIFLAISTIEFLQQLTHEKPEWWFALMPLFALTILSFATNAWFARHPENKIAARKPILHVALIYRWLALLMSLLWLWDYVPARQHVWAFMLAAVLVFGLALWRTVRESLFATAVYAFISLNALWWQNNFNLDVYWPNLLSLLALIAMQQMLRRAATKLPLPENIHGIVVFIFGMSLWRFVCCWTNQFASGLSETMTWAGLAVIIFATGMFLRERFLRWFGLGVLAAAVGRVVLVDVWKQETIYRVLTFMALGLALLVIGFIYNKFQDSIRKWL